MYKIKYIILMLFIFFSISVQGQANENMVSFDFENTEIKEILRAIAINNDVNIIPDNNVSGKVSVHISKVPLETALSTFLLANGFKLTKKDEIYRVSKIKENPFIKVIDNKLTIHADNVDINQVIREISTQAKINVIAGKSLNIKVTAHLNNVEPLSGLEKIINENGLSIRKEKDLLKVYPVKPKYTVYLNDEKNRMNIEADNTDIKVILQEISRKSQRNIVVEDNIRQMVTVHLENVDFETGLDAFLDMYDLKIARYENIYKVYQAEKGFKIPITFKNGLLTLDIRHGSLESALRQITNRAGYNLVIFGNLQSKINIQFKNIPLNEALKLLLKNTPFVFKFNEEDRLLLIGQAGISHKESDLFTYRKIYYLNNLPVRRLLNVLPHSIPSSNIKTIEEDNSFTFTGTEEMHNLLQKFIKNIDIEYKRKIIPVKHMPVKELVSMLPNYVHKDSINIIDEQNAFLITAPDSIIIQVGKLIEKIDVRPAVIMVEALVVEISDEAKRELGLSGMTGQKNKVSGVYTPLTGTQLIYNSLGTLDKEFTATLSALENKGLVEIKASPKITTTSGRSAVINVGRDEIYRVTVPSSNSSVPLTKLEKIPSGIRLQIRPWASINSDQITVELSSEVSSSSGQASASELPTISKRTASTNLLLKDGETVIIGGLKTVDKTDAVEQIPLLGSIPIIGRLFGKSVKRKKKTELTFFITTHIVKEQGNEVSIEKK